MQDPRIAVHEGEISAHLEGAPLNQVLDTLHQQVPMRVNLPSSLQSRAVWARFDGLPFDRALERLLQGVSYVLTRDANSVGGQTNTTQVALLILTTGTAGRDSGNYVTVREDSHEKLAWSVRYAATPKDRLAALTELYYSGARGTRSVIEAALADQNLSVRKGAFDLIANAESGAEIDIDGELLLIERVANQETDQELRVEALYLLSDMDPRQAEESARNALADPNPRMRAEAEELLEVLRND